MGNFRTHTHIFQRLWFRFYNAYLFQVVFCSRPFFSFIFLFLITSFFSSFLSLHTFFFFVIFLHYGQRCNKHTVKRMSSIYSRDCQLYAAMNTNRQVSPTYVCCTVISAVVHVVESHQTPSLLRLLSSPLPMCTILCSRAATDLIRSMTTNLTNMLSQHSHAGKKLIHRRITANLKVCGLLP